MQQTSKYQFNLVEGSDDFSPTPLNQNMEKVEEALEELEGAVDTAQTARYVSGSVTISSSTAAGTVLKQFDFAPSCVIAYAGSAAIALPNGSERVCDHYSNMEDGTHNFYILLSGNQLKLFNKATAVTTTVLKYIALK